MKDITDKLVTINFNELKNYKPEFNKKIGLTVLYDDVKFEFILNFKENSDKLLVLGSGALGFRDFDRTRPYIERHSWNFNSSTIHYHDPTYYLDDSIRIGWCIGTKDNYYLEKIAEIVSIFVDKLNIINNNVLFYGSSAGGFTSLMLSVLFKGSICLADIPQLYVYKYKSKKRQYDSWKDLKKICYDDLSDEEFIDKYKRRLSLIEMIKNEKYIPNANIIMDFSVKLDVDTQYMPFIQELDKVLVDKESNKINLIIDGKQNGHAPISKKDTIDLINTLLSETSENSIEKEIQSKLSNDNIHLSNTIINKLEKYNTSRIDIELNGKNPELKVSPDENTEMTLASWNKDPNKKTFVLKNNHNFTDFKIHCLQEGNLIIRLRGVDFKDKKRNRIPIYINYTKLLINEDTILNNDTYCWHNTPFLYKKEVKKDEIIKVHVEWLPC